MNYRWHAMGLMETMCFGFFDLHINRLSIDSILNLTSLQNLFDSRTNHIGRRR